MLTKITFKKYIPLSAAGIVILALAMTVIIQNRHIDSLIGEKDNNYHVEGVEKYKAEIRWLESQIADMQAWQDFLEDELGKMARTSTPAPQNIPSGNIFADNTPRIIENPAMRNSLRPAVFSRYDSFAEEIGLSEEKRSMLMDLLTEMQMEIMSTMPGRRGFAPGMTDRETMRQQIEEITSIYNEEISELLSGNELYAFREYQNSEPERMLIMALNNTIFEGDGRLDKESEKELVAAMYNARQDNPETKTEDSSLTFFGGPFGRGRMGGRVENQEAINVVYIESAKNVLSYDQMQKFEDYLTTNQSLFNMRKIPPP